MKLCRTTAAVLTFLMVIAAYAVFISSVEANAPVQILSHTGYIDSSGYYHVVGEVKNDGAQAVNSVVIWVTFYDSNNASITDRFDSTMLNVLLVGRKSPFDIPLLNTVESALVDHYSINFTFSTTISIPMELEVMVNRSYIDNVERLHVTGEIKNIGNKQAVSVKLVTTYYDKTGKVTAATLKHLDPEQPNLNPDQVAAFDILLEDEARVQQVAAYEVTAESMQYAAIPEFTAWISVLLPLALLETAMIFRRVKRRGNTGRATGV